MLDLTIAQQVTVKAIAVANNYESSDVVTTVIVVEQLRAPFLELVNSEIIMSAEEMCEIYYTLDDTTPTPFQGSTSVYVDHLRPQIRNQSIICCRAMSCKEGFARSQESCLYFSKVYLNFT